VLAQGGEGHRRPDRGVGVLAAVFAHAGHVALDVAGVERRAGRTAGRAAGSGRPRAAPGARPPPAWPGARAGSPPPESTDQLCEIESIRHSSLRPSPAACRRRNRRGDTRRRPSRAVRCSAAAGARAGSARRRSVAARARARRRTAQHLVQEEAQPDALALALHADPVHAVVPVAGTDQRQAVLAEAQAVRMARTQCSYRLAASSETAGRS
jgi:hypothetical protein